MQKVFNQLKKTIQKYEIQLQKGCSEASGFHKKK